MTHTAQPAPSLQNWKQTLAYDGTGFSGWQIQPGELTIQRELQAALHRVTGESPLPQGSGRTDAGVHALGQVASFALAANIPAENLQRALNRTLPPSIRVLQAKTVRSAFHARHSAIAKTYEYRVFQDSLCPPFLARYVHACPWPMDLEVLQSAAAVFIGEHNFLSFAATDPDLAARQGLSPTAALDQDGSLQAEPRSTTNVPALRKKHGAVRIIDSSTWERRASDSGSLLIYRVRGNGFLHHMVRNLVGTMLDAGRGHTPLAALPAILAARSRAAAGPTAPAQGLFLHSVEYEDSAECDHSVEPEQGQQSPWPTGLLHPGLPSSEP
jgi:tRNA pseudouridine38-40 synthase